jgi:Ser/Thr protein kinase RdoA (MazF antagonist)
MKHNIVSIARQFRPDGDFLDAKPWGNGHINDTYLALYGHADNPCKIIIQRINHSIFKNPPAVMENIVRVTDHIREKLRAQGCTDIPRRVLTVISTADGIPCHRDEGGYFWRAYVFIEGGKTRDVPESPAFVAEMARMFGGFLSMLADLPAPSLHETIPDFHNGPKRLLAFENAVKSDPCNHARGAKAEIEYIRSHTETFGVLTDLADAGRIPIRVTHNDTKINNVIFDHKTNKGLCVIDLDTVMPGLTLYDFGDMVRTATCTASEDEQDLSKVTMDVTLFGALVEGFIEASSSMLTPIERRHLPVAGLYITLEQAARFLTDYLLGDVYYKVHRPGHNLDRCRTQIKLAQSILDQQQEMLSLVKRL